jgi:hypothetical protein
VPNPFVVATEKDFRNWIKAETDPVEGVGENPRMTHFSLLSSVQKMQCLSFGLPALSAPMNGGVLVTCPGSIASLKTPKGICHICYAIKNRYLYSSVKTSMDWRLEFSQWPDFWEMMIDAIQHPADYMSNKKALKGMNKKYFRVHHSGDFYSTEYVQQWIKICEYFAEKRPSLSFWFPTRVWAMRGGKKKRNMMSAITDLAELPNVTVRPSVLQFDQPMTEVEDAWIPGWAAPTGAFLAKPIKVGSKGKKETWKPDEDALDRMLEEGVWMCPATSTKDEKGMKTCDTMKCRVCWNESETMVAYKQH